MGVACDAVRREIGVGAKVRKKREVMERADLSES